MTIYIAMLRGINVGESRKLLMEDLRRICADLGFAQVQTYIQSGNVIFSDTKNSVQKLEALIAGAIAREFEFEVPVMVVDLDELKAIIRANPFPSDFSKDASLLHVTFLSAAPDRKRMASLEAGNFLPEEMRCIGRTVYLYCPNGYGRSKLTNNFFENSLKVTATTRNWNTVNRLVSLAQKPPLA